MTDNHNMTDREYANPKEFAGRVEIDGEPADVTPAGPMVELTWKTKDPRFTVSYRNRWWHRRLHAAGNISAAEAVTLAGRLVHHGYRKVRIEIF